MCVLFAQILSLIVLYISASRPDLLCTHHRQEKHFKRTLHKKYHFNESEDIIIIQLKQKRRKASKAARKLSPASTGLCRLSSLCPERASKKVH